MPPAKPSALALLPTALLFGLGIGNLWGIAGLFSRLGKPEWTWAFAVLSPAVLVACLCGVARAWWSRGAIVPLFATVVAGWGFSAPWAALTGKFTTSSWALWLLVLLCCGGLAFLIAWLIGRRKPTDAMPNISLERTREG